jgi:hypothetical protein
MTETMKYKLVPVEPTKEMLDAAMNARVHLNVLPHGWSAAYRAMLAAAPASPAVGEEELAELLREFCEWQERGNDDDCEYLNGDGWDDLDRLVVRARAILSRTPAQSDNRIREVVPAYSENTPAPWVEVVWIDFADNGNVRFWTADVARAERERQSGTNLRAFTVPELTALVSKIGALEASLAEARKVIGAAQGHLLNALIDLQTSTPKKTTIRTIEGGIKITRDWLSRNSES